MLILRPRASRMAPKDAEAIPLPSEETTPPVTKTNRFMMSHRRLNVCPPLELKADAQTKPKGTIGIRREFRLPEHAHLDNPNERYLTLGRDIRVKHPRGTRECTS